MNRLYGISADQLIALEFSKDDFRKAVGMAIKHDIWIDVPGRHNLIIKKEDEYMFRDFHYVMHPVVSAAEIPPAELAELRRHRFAKEG